MTDAEIEKRLSSLEQRMALMEQRIKRKDAPDICRMIDGANGVKYWLPRCVGGIQGKEGCTCTRNRRT